MVTSIGGPNERWARIAELQPPPAVQPGGGGGPGFGNSGTVTTDVPPISSVAGSTASPLSNDTNFLLTVFGGGTQVSTQANASLPATRQNPTSPAGTVAARCAAEFVPPDGEWRRGRHHRQHTGAGTAGAGIRRRAPVLAWEQRYDFRRQGRRTAATRSATAIVLCRPGITAGTIRLSRTTGGGSRSESRHTLRAICPARPARLRCRGESRRSSAVDRRLSGAPLVPASLVGRAMTGVSIQPGVSLDRRYRVRPEVSSRPGYQ